MPITNWDKFYLGIILITISLILGIYIFQGVPEAQSLSQQIFIPLISILLLIGVAIQIISQIQRKRSIMNN